MGHYRTFLVIGGMPASIVTWIETHDFRECMAELSSIQQSYYDDFAKYANKIRPEVLRNTLQSVIAQTGNKFIFSKVSVGWELVKGADPRSRYELFYWEKIKNGTSSEVDFIIPHDLKILPVEVKSGKSGKMKSLRIFMERKGLDYAVRTSLGNFSLLTLSDSDETPSSPAKSIEIIPIYAVNSLTRPQRIPSPPGNQG